ncbi:hypothetical protein [Paenibacillus sp. MMS18-CY102]|uniref:hypothetical protein n=1 Tax=Paenibacillus sp. MMS18-CY102 TaxID=2682849 RepID=UPI001365B1FD|nr:hypothetical protein [Paenibacillus sp. MMS18-CY102]MWC27563.1 hypothetical protein [Paenibacillus sp. MMS18-CY102]
MNVKSIMRNVSLRYALIILAIMLLFLNHHLGYSIGDSLLRSIGISPWTEGEGEGMHLPAMICTLALVIVVPMALRHYRKRHTRVLRTMLILFIVLQGVYPIVAKNTMFAIRHNTSGAASVDYDRNNISCQYQSSGVGTIPTTCTFKIFNYGNASSVAITPSIFARIGYPPKNIVVQPAIVPVVPHTTRTITAVFESSPIEGFEQATFNTNRVALKINIP